MKHCTVNTELKWKKDIKRSYGFFRYSHTEDACADGSTQTHGEHSIFVVSNQQRGDHILAKDLRAVKDYRRIASETLKEWWSPQTLESARIFERKHLRRHWQQRAKVILSPTTLNPQRLLMVRTKRQSSHAMKGQRCPPQGSQKTFSKTKLCGRVNKHHYQISTSFMKQNCIIVLSHTQFIKNISNFCTHCYQLRQRQHMIK